MSRKRLEEDIVHLYGLMDSPFVRRTAISMTFLGLTYEHTKWSIFRNAAEYSNKNPLLKAPTLVLDDGTVLMESAIILEYLERLAPSEKSLMPKDLSALAKAQRVTGIALIACEKGVQLMLERMVREEAQRSDMFLQRFTSQLQAAFFAIESELPEGEGWIAADRPMQADITAAVTWGFIQSLHADLVPAETYPKYAAFAERAEALPAFRAAPLK